MLALLLYIGIELEVTWSFFHCLNRGISLLLLFDLFVIEISINENVMMMMMCGALRRARISCNFWINWNRRSIHTYVSMTLNIVHTSRMECLVCANETFIVNKTIFCRRPTKNIEFVGIFKNALHRSSAYRAKPKSKHLFMHTIFIWSNKNFNFRINSFFHCVECDVVDFYTQIPLHTCFRSK